MKSSNLALACRQSEALQQWIKIGAVVCVGVQCKVVVYSVML